MKVAIYARVSTTEQDVNNQLMKLRQLCEFRGWEIYEEYIDVMSGGTDKRPGYQKLMKDAFHHRFDAVLVWKLDRFGRNLNQLITDMDRLRSWGIDFISYTEQIDTTSPWGKFIFHTIAAIAEFERDMIRERTKLGLERARAEGKRIGRPPINEVTRDMILKCKADHPDWGIRRIAKAVGASKSTVYRILNAQG